MHILLVADGRSPITQRWIRSVLAIQHQVTLVSTFPCEAPPGVEAMHVLPVALAGLAGSQVGQAASSTSVKRTRKWISRFRALFLAGRYWIGPLTLGGYGRRFRKLVDAIQPDLIHAMRIPFEGMLASYAPPSVPLAVSIWGNDLTYHANGSVLMRKLTRRTLRRADALVADARRDLRLGVQWGFAPEKPTLVVPGGAGVDLMEFGRLRGLSDQSFIDLLPAGVPLVVNPRGFRPGSVRNDTFFQALPLVLERWPSAYFVCTGMAGQTEALRWMHRLKLKDHVRLLPFLPQAQLWNLFMRSSILVSVSAHDGTPNSFLEGIACGCFPIVGDIESLREWITPGINGLLVPPDNPQALAEALITALSNPGLIPSAAEYNLNMIQKRAETGLVKAQLEVFYQRLVNQTITTPL